ncbi:MAG: flippase [Firmicutes bacterium HGW-Firmicutes-1]|jgi:O-antigen/teichoic acid export membrane protein|nr:MAG: flippase [Firmicutes bacterium HGW-Firmicutes-1]
MNALNMKNTILYGLFWKLMERGGTQGIQFIVQIILARLLLPEYYGLIALITVFIAIANVFVQSGFSTALIQKKDVDELDFNSVFYIGLSVAIVMYIIIFFSAPLIAAFYKEPKLILVLRVLSLTLFFGAMNAIQMAIVSRTMQFKRFFFSSLGGIIISGVVGIAMAFMGFGVWALVGQQLSNGFVVTSILWFTVQWQPKFQFSLARVKSLFAFGWKLLVSSLLETVYNNVYGLVIGRTYNAQMLGYYNRGDQFPNMIVTNINGTISSVLLPSLAAHQQDKDRVKRMVRRSIVTSAFIIFPAMVGLAVCAHPLVRILLTDKWLACVPFLQLMCISYAFWPIHTANLQAINALGRSDIFLKLEIIKKCLGVAVLCVSIPFGIYVMIAFKPIVSFVSTLINSFPNRKLLNYSFKEQWLDIMPSTLLSITMGVIIYAINFIGWNAWVTLILQLSIGTVLYLGMAHVFKLECYRYLVDTIKEFFWERKQERCKNEKFDHRGGRKCS